MYHFLGVHVFTINATHTQQEHKLELIELALIFSHPHIVPVGKYGLKLIVPVGNNTVVLQT